MLDTGLKARVLKGLGMSKNKREKKNKQKKNNPGRH